jgi:hypothetical protein
VRRRVALGVLFVSVVLLAVAVIQLARELDPTRSRNMLRAANDVRSIAVSIDAWSKENGGRHPDADSIEKLQRLLVPRYADSLPLTDPWGHPYRYELLRDPKTTAINFYVATPGRDGVWEEPRLDAYSQQVYIMESPDEDQVWKNVLPVRSAGCQCGGEYRWGLSPSLRWLLASALLLVIFIVSTALSFRWRPRVSGAAP